MKRFLISLALLLIISITGCIKETTSCRGTAIPSCACTNIYDPVCGCDGKTYGSECEAKCAGLTSGIKGKCP